MAVTSISPLSTKILHLQLHNALYQHVREHKNQLSTYHCFCKILFLFAITSACPWSLNEKPVWNNTLKD